VVLNTGALKFERVKKLKNGGKNLGIVDVLGGHRVSPLTNSRGLTQRRRKVQKKKHRLVEVLGAVQMAIKKSA